MLCNRIHPAFSFLFLRIFSFNLLQIQSSLTVTQFFHNGMPDSVTRIRITQIRRIHIVVDLILFTPRNKLCLSMGKQWSSYCHALVQHLLFQAIKGRNQILFLLHDICFNQIIHMMCNQHPIQMIPFNKTDKEIISPLSCFCFHVSFRYKRFIAHKQGYIMFFTELSDIGFLFFCLWAKMIVDMSRCNRYSLLKAHSDQCH